MDLPTNYTALNTRQRRSVRIRYIGLQHGLCHHCKKSLLLDPPKCITDKKVNVNLFPKHFFRSPVHLHHNHETHMTIGAVHSYCNAVLWEYHGE